MPGNFLYSVGAAFIVSLIGFIGVFALLIKEKFLNKIILLLVSFSAGAMMGGAFFHIIPESIELLPGLQPFLIVLIGFSIFFLIEKILHWRHCHTQGCAVHAFGYLNIYGDGIHNFIDGLIIATSFNVDIKLGIATTLAIILHEIPQEMGDFGVLIHAGFSKGKALFYNYLSAVLAIAGAIVGYFIGNTDSFSAYLLSFAAGGFLYIAATDLIPELKKETQLKKSIVYFAIFILGAGFMYAFKILME